jgi:hypothetical protein
LSLSNRKTPQAKNGKEVPLEALML